MVSTLATILPLRALFFLLLISNSILGYIPLPENFTFNFKIIANSHEINTDNSHVYFTGFPNAQKKLSITTSMLTLIPWNSGLPCCDHTHLLPHPTFSKIPKTDSVLCLQFFHFENVSQMASHRMRCWGVGFFSLCLRDSSNCQFSLSFIVFLL